MITAQGTPKLNPSGLPSKVLPSKQPLRVEEEKKKRKKAKENIPQLTWAHTSSNFKQNATINPQCHTSKSFGVRCWDPHILQAVCFPAAATLSMLLLEHYLNRRANLFTLTQFYILMFNPCC